MYAETVIPSVTKTVVSTFADNAFVKFVGAGLA